MDNIINATSDFETHCRHERRLSPNTLKSYKIDLGQFLSYLDNDKYQPLLSTIDKTIIKSYVESLSSFQPKTIKRKIATLKAFFNFLEFEDRILINPFRKIRIRIKEPQRLPTVLTLDEVQRIFDAVADIRRSAWKKSIYKNFESLRNIALIELLFATGARVSEVSHLKKNDIDLQSGTLKVVGKGNKERIIQICNHSAICILREYSKTLDLIGECSSNSFFINRLHRRLSEQSIRIIVKRVSQVAKIPKHITPHIFRHSFATLLLEEGVDIKFIQSILGHSSIITTQIYTHVNKSKQNEILQLKHPRQKIKMQQDE